MSATYPVQVVPPLPLLSYFPTGGAQGSASGVGATAVAGRWLLSGGVSNIGRGVGNEMVLRNVYTFCLKRVKEPSALVGRASAEWSLAQRRDEGWRQSSVKDMCLSFGCSILFRLFWLGS